MKQYFSIGTSADRRISTLILVLFLLSVNFPVFSQIILGSPINEKDQEKELLDMATIRVYYSFRQKEKANEKPFRNDMMTLDIGSQMSHYYDETKKLKDSLFNQAFTDLSSDRIQSISVLNDNAAFSDNFLGERYEMHYFDGTSEKIYKNRINGELTIVDQANGAYRCKDPVGVLNWEVTSDTATVLNYSCQKAKLRFRGRNYEAWFAPDLPINDGPWKFMGLPGLILSVNDTEGLIAFEAVGLQYLETPYSIEISKEKYIKCNRKELAKAIRDRGDSMTVGINGGNVIISRKGLDAFFPFLELE
ncbi:MAG: GLPGLI family protein [Tannerella sp.]|jgi:GLPGLI family protein|nr:GLPGLI family protein [Tannerella sp.]